MQELLCLFEEHRQASKHAPALVRCSFDVVVRASPVVPYDKRVDVAVAAGAGGGVRDFTDRLVPPTDEKFSADPQAGKQERGMVHVYHGFVSRTPSYLSQ